MNELTYCLLYVVGPWVRGSVGRVLYVLPLLL